MADNTIKIKFISEGDKGLVKAIEKLDAVHKKLTQAQENLIDVGKKGGRANVKAINTLRKYNDLLKKNNLTLKDIGINSFTYSTAIRGNQLSLEKVRVATLKHVQALKKQKRGMFETEHSTRILGGSFAVLRSKLLLASFAGTLLASTVGRLARQFGVQEDAERDLSTALGRVNNELLKQASALQEITTHGDESLLQVMRFASTLGIEEEKLFDVTRASIGLSEAYKIGLNQSTRMLALATSGNTEMLNRYIPELRNAQTESEKLTIINEKANEGFRLHTERVGTLNFTLDQMGNAVGDVAEQIGKVLSPAVIFTANRMKEFAMSMDEAKVKRFQLILGTVTAGFVAYRTAVIASAIATNGFSRSLTKTGLGAVIVLAGIAVEQLMAMAGLFEDNEESINNLNNKITSNNKLTKEQIEKINKVQEALENKKKSIDDEIASLLLKEAELLNLSELDQLELELGHEFVSMNKKKIETLLKLRATVKSLVKAEEDKVAQDKKQEKADKKSKDAQEQHAKDLQAVRDTIFANDVQYQLDQLNLRKQEMEALGLNGAEQIALEQFIADERQRILQQDADEMQKIIDDRNNSIKEMREDIYQNDLHYQLLELEAKKEHYLALAQTEEEKLAVDEHFQERRREMAENKLEQENVLYNATLSSYDAFVNGLIDADMTVLEAKDAMNEAFKEAMVRFVADMIKEQIKAFVIERVIRKASDKAAEKDALISGKLIAEAYKKAALNKSLATSGKNAIAATVATEILKNSIATAEDGGLIGGRRHSQGGTLIEAEQGEFIMSRNAVESIGLENLAKMNQGGGAGVTINIQGNMVGNEEFVRDTLIPEIDKTINRGLA
tara:strand:+ start:1604 stop:4138 length:2535 start_codon:yes stop_codon:yes gene_type:complete